MVASLRQYWGVSYPPSSAFSQRLLCGFLHNNTQGLFKASPPNISNYPKVRYTKRTHSLAPTLPFGVYLISRHRDSLRSYQTSGQAIRPQLFSGTPSSSLTPVLHVGPKKRPRRRSTCSPQSSLRPLAPSNRRTQATHAVESINATRRHESSSASRYAERVIQTYSIAEFVSEWKYETPAWPRPGQTRFV